MLDTKTNLELMERYEIISSVMVCRGNIMYLDVKHRRRTYTFETVNVRTLLTQVKEKFRLGVVERQIWCYWDNMPRAGEIPKPLDVMKRPDVPLPVKEYVMRYINESMEFDW